MALYCKWIRVNGDRCDLPAEKNGEYCYRHLPMAYAGIPHEKAKDDGPKPIIVVGRPQVGNSADIRVSNLNISKEDHWRKSMDKLADKLNPPKKDRKFRSTLWVESDFPRHIDGIFFQKLDDYEDYVYGQYDARNTQLQEEYVDELIPPFDTASPTTKAWQGKGGYRSSESESRQDNWDMTEQEWDAYLNDYEKRTTGNYKSVGFYQAPAAKTMKPNSYQKQDTIQHMHYYIARGSDGKYYSVWVSTTKPEAVKDIMAQAMKNLGCSVTQCEWGRYHTSKAYDTWSDADRRFSCGGESFWNIRTRMDRAKDPDWIPPNLRMAAFEGKWDIIPEEYKQKCREWFDKGCPGWYGTWHSQKSFKRMAAQNKGGRVLPAPKGSRAVPRVLEDPKVEMQRFLAASSMGVVSEKDARPSGCRYRVFDGTACGKVVNCAPYCDEHNIKLYGYPKGRASLL